MGSRTPSSTPWRACSFTMSCALAVISASTRDPKSRPRTAAASSSARVSDVSIPRCSSSVAFIPAVVERPARRTPSRIISRTNRGLPSLTRNTSSALGSGPGLALIHAATSSRTRRRIGKTSPSRPIFASASATAGDNRGSISRAAPSRQSGHPGACRDTNSSNKRDGRSAAWRSSRKISVGCAAAAPVSTRAAASKS